MGDSELCGEVKLERFISGLSDRETDEPPEIDAPIEGDLEDALEGNLTALVVNSPVVVEQGQDIEVLVVGDSFSSRAPGVIATPRDIGEAREDPLKSARGNAEADRPGTLTPMLLYETTLGLDPLDDFVVGEVHRTGVDVENHLQVLGQDAGLVIRSQDVKHYWTDAQV